MKRLGVLVLCVLFLAGCSKSIPTDNLESLVNPFGDLFPERLQSSNNSVYAFGVAPLSASDNSAVSSFSKFSASGIFIEQKKAPFGTGYSAEAVSKSGDVYVAGLQSRRDPVIAFFAFLIKYDSTGRELWRTTFSEIPNEYASSILGVELDASGNVYVLSGDSEIPIAGPSTKNYLRVWKISPSGVLLKTYEYKLPVATTDAGGNPINYVSWESSAVRIDSLGNIYLLHNFVLSTIAADMRILKFEPSGKIAWNRIAYAGVYNNVNRVHRGDFVIDVQGNFYLGIVQIGCKSINDVFSGTCTSDTFVRKLDKNVNHLWTRQIWIDFRAPSIVTDGTNLYYGYVYKPYATTGKACVVVTKLDGNNVKTWVKNLCFEGRYGDANYSKAVLSDMSLSDGVYLIGRGTTRAVEGAGTNGDGIPFFAKLNKDTGSTVWFKQ